MAVWKFNGTSNKDYPTLRFIAEPNDLVRMSYAPDAQWSNVTDSGQAETVYRYGPTAEAVAYVEPPNGAGYLYDDGYNSPSPDSISLQARIENSLAQNPTVTAAAASATTDAVAAQGLIARSAMPTLVTNLITNPSFEVNTTGWAVEAGATIARVGTDFHSGSASLLVTQTADSAVSAYVPAVPTVAGRTYTLSFWAKRSAGARGVGGFVQGAQSGANRGTFFQSGIATWARVSMSFVADGTSVNLFFFNSASPGVGGSIGDAFFLDSVMLYEGVAPYTFFDGSTPGCYWTGAANASSSVRLSPAVEEYRATSNPPELARNLIPDPSFEYGNRESWLAGGAGSVDGATAVEFTRQRSGARSMRLASGAAGDIGIQLNVGYQVAASPGQTFTLSGWVRTDSGELPFAQIQFRDASNQIVSGGSGFVTRAAAASSGIYQRVVATGTAPAGTVFAQPFIGFAATAAGQGGNVDDVMLVKSFSKTSLDYFDGDTPGCRWTGAVGLSASIKTVPSPSEYLDGNVLPDLAVNLIPNPLPTLADQTYLSGIGGVDGTYSDASDATVPSGVYTRRTAPAGGSGAMGFGVFAPFLEAGEYTGFYYARTNKTTLVPYSIEGTASESGPGVSGSISVTANAWRRVDFKMTLATGGSVKIGAYANVNTAGDYLDLSSIFMTRGTALNSDWFSGDSPGCQWEGARLRSQSVKHRLLPSEVSLLTWLDAGRAQGVGSPEGIVTARVGTRYVDTAATNGAIEWIKASGTGNTGWIVTQGDTGWRNVVVFNNGSVTQGAFGSSSWGPDPTNSGHVRIRRVNDRVYMQMQWVRCLVANGTGSMIDLPVGFRGTGATPVTFTPIGPGLAMVGLTYSSSLLRNQGTTAVGDTFGRFCSQEIFWPTQNAWPTTLPGTAV